MTPNSVSEINPKTVVTALLVASVGGYYATKYWQKYQRRLHLTQLRKDKQKTKAAQKLALNNSLDKSLLNTEEAKTILNMNMEEMISFLKKDPNNYKKIFNIYQHQAFLQDQKLNCVIEFIPLDISDVDLTGPFAGLPISLKDNVPFKGYETYVGCSIFLGQPKVSESCVVAQVLQKLGAIPFARTVVPQAILTNLSSNPIDGNFKNPQNENFIAGGSSSGDAALVGAKGVLLACGTDIAGSIRIPASFCGVVGFKPTVGRLSHKGTKDVGIPTFVHSTLGPICPDVKSCVFTMKSIFNSEHMSILDPRVPYLQFNDNKFNKKKLKIGYFVHDNSYHVVPAMRRAVEETVKKLKDRGHELVEWKPHKTGKDWWKLTLRGLTLDGARKFYSILEDDQVDRAVLNGIIHTDTNIFSALINKLKYKLPDWMVDADAKLRYNCTKETPDGQGIIDLLNEIETFREDVEKNWSNNGLDAVICPAGGCTAIPVNTYFLYYPIMTYIFIWNLLNFPAGTVPVTKVNRKDIEEMQSNPIFKSTRTMRNVSSSQINTEGLSVSVQCVAAPWNEELCLNLMKEVENISSK